MKTSNIIDMVKGWFIGDITPVAFSTPYCEVAYKEYKAGDYDSAHYHKMATEVTLIVSGKVKMGGKIFDKGTIITTEPFEIVDFLAIEDSSTVVIKVPGAKNDKYLADDYKS